MHSEPKTLAKTRFYSSVITLNVITLLFAGYLINPYTFTGKKNRTVAYNVESSQLKPTEVLPSQKVITGKPVRLVIGPLSIDLPVDEGIYNESDQTWNISAKHAQYAMPSMYANNIRGNTLIYGENNANVFYNLKQIQPGTLAEVYTDNGHIFTYKFRNQEQLKPDDVTVFDYQSYPMLTLQTCSGSFYEFRQMFYFKLISIDGQNV